MGIDDGYIDKLDDLRRLAEAISRVPVVAVDMESNGFFCYPESVCLVQVAFGGTEYLVDAVVLDDITPLLEVLADQGRLSILHACSYDVSSFKRDYDFRFGKIFDTSIAAAFLGGERLGLGTVLEEALGVVIPKDKKLQRCDWGRRPLDERQIAYAKSDVAHMIELYELQSRKLRDLGRLRWVEEECERARTTPWRESTSDERFEKVKGVSKLPPLARSVFKSLFLRREKLALATGKPPFKIFSNELISRISQRCAETGAVPDASSAHIPGRYRRDIVEAVREGLANGPLPLPPRIKRRPRLDKRQMDRLGRMKEWRAALAAELGLAPSLLWPTPMLDVLARCDTCDDAIREIESGDVRKWQMEEFGEGFLDGFFQGGFQDSLF